MSQTTITVPPAVVGAVHFLERNWVAIVGICIVAVLASIVTEVTKRHINVNKEVQTEVDRAKKIVRWTLLATSSGFTLLGYFIWFVQANEPTLKQLPVIGQSEVEVLGVAWGLYNFRLNKTFATWAARLGKWSSAKPAKSQLPQPQPEVALETGSVSEDQLL